MVIPVGVTRANVRASTRLWSVDCLAPRINSLGGDELIWPGWPLATRLEESARVRSATRPQLRETTRPIRKRRLRNAARGLDFVFIVRISDALMSLALFKHARQQIFVILPAWRVSRRKGGTVAAATPQRVGKRMRLCRLICAIVFGEADPPAGDTPAATEDVLLTQRGGYNDVSSVAACR